MRICMQLNFTNAHHWSFRFIPSCRVSVCTEAKGWLSWVDSKTRKQKETIEDEDEAPYIISVFFFAEFHEKKMSQCSKLSTFVGLEFLRKNTPKQLLQNTIPSWRHRGRKLESAKDSSWMPGEAESDMAKPRCPKGCFNRNSWAILFLFFFGMQEIKITKIKWKSVRVISFFELQQIFRYLPTST